MHFISVLSKLRLIYHTSLYSLVHQNSLIIRHLVFSNRIFQNLPYFWSRNNVRNFSKPFCFFSQFQFCFIQETQPSSIKCTLELCYLEKDRQKSYCERFLNAWEWEDLIYKIQQNEQLLESTVVWLKALN